MTTINSLLSSLINDLKGLEQVVSQLNSGNSPSLSNFADALANAETTAQQALSANSAASTGSGTGLNSNLLDPTTLAHLLNSSSNSGQAAGTAHLLPAGAAPDGIHKPSMAQFMTTTGCSSDTASDVLYGSIGSNVDLRDWQAIMASSNPLADARASTSAMYNSSLNYASPAERVNDFETPGVMRLASERFD